MATFLGNGRGLGARGRRYDLLSFVGTTRKLQKGTTRVVLCDKLLIRNETIREKTRDEVSVFPRTTLEEDLPRNETRFS